MDVRRHIAALGLVVGVAGSNEAAIAAAVISSGPGGVALGVNDHGHLNFAGVGLRFDATGHDGIAAGCACEGWGVGIASLAISGYANETEGGAVNLSLVSFEATAERARAVVTVDNGAGAPVLRVTHDYRPSPLTNRVYEVSVRIENVSGLDLGSGATDLRYRRVMDWDVEPTPFEELVTIGGAETATHLLDSRNDGFDTADPLTSFGPNPFIPACAPHPDPGPRSFTDCGPGDHGVLFDFGFEALRAIDDPATARDETLRSFTIFYGATASEDEADFLRALLGAEVFSYGQCADPADSRCSATTGMPNTFILAFRDVGGIAPPLPPPVAGVPAPATLSLVGLGMLALGAAGRRRRECWVLTRARRRTPAGAV